MPAQQLRAAIANRVSQVKGASIPQQDAENTAWCEANGIEIYDRYEEAGSASRYARKARKKWPMLLSDLADGRFDIVVLWESSRGDRTLASWIGFLDLCLEMGVVIHVTSDERTYDMANTTDYSSLALAGISNREDSEKTSKRVNRAVRAQATAGKPHGRIPWSYRRTYEFVPDPETGRQVRIVHQVPDEVKGPATDEMADRVFAGESIGSIGRDMAARFGGTWNSRRIRDILLNPTIAGLRVHQGEVVGKADWPPVLVGRDGETAEEKFYRLVAKLNDPARRTAPLGAPVKHLLSGILLCGEGGDLDWPAALTAEHRASLTCAVPCYRAKGQSYPAYVCREKYHVSARAAFIDELVEEAVLLRLSQEDAAVVFARPDNGETRRARQEAAKLQARLDGFYSQAAKGKLSDTGIARIEAELLPEIARWEKKAAPKPYSPLVGQLIAAKDIRALWRDLSLPQQREAIRTVVTPIIVPVGKKSTGSHRRVKFIWRGVSA